MTDTTKRSEFLGEKPEPKIKEHKNLKNGNLIFVDGGTFNMGDSAYVPWEEPVHKVKVSDFYISKYQVTQEEWAKLMNKNPSIYKEKGHPVENISWYKAIEFCNKKSMWDRLIPCYEINKRAKDINNINEKDDLQWEIKCDFTKNGYRLPTEAEWEFAARGGNISRNYLYSGFEELDLVGCFEENNFGSHSAVGMLLENELGIKDMSGNVYEWCWDWFGDYSAEEQHNPTGPDSGKYRILRGGSWNERQFFSRNAARNFFNPCSVNNMIGLRLVRNP